MRHGLESGGGEGEQHGETIGEAAARQVIDIDRRARGQQSGDARDKGGAVGSHLKGPASDELGGDAGEILRERARGLFGRGHV